MSGHHTEAASSDRLTHAKLDPTRRYLLAIPLGGFNDMLVQLERCLVYAEKYRRDVILDTRFSGIKLPFDALFQPPEIAGVRLHLRTDEIATELDRFDSVFPSEMRHDISTMKHAWNKEQHLVCEVKSGKMVSFDFSRDYAARLLIHAQPGGGLKSIQALRRFRLQPDIARTIVQRLTPLRRGYDAIHIRHSDYKSNYRWFLFRLRFLLRGRTVLICSDSAAAKRAARWILPRSTRLISVSDIPDIGERPLHHSQQIDPKLGSLDMLTDLYAMALSDRLYVAQVNGSWRKTPGWSGFSQLALMLQQDRAVIAQHLGGAGDEIAELIAQKRSVQPAGLERVKAAYDGWLNRPIAETKVYRDRALSHDPVNTDWICRPVKAEFLGKE